VKGQRGGPVELKPDNLEYSTNKGPEMARIGGGMNARIGVVVFAVVLVGVIGVAIANRPQAVPIAAATARPSAVALASETATAAPADPTALPLTPPARPMDSFGVLLNVGDVGYMTTLDQLGTDHFSAVLRVPIPLARDSGTLEFNQIRTFNGSQRTEQIGLWRIPLTALDDPKREATELVNREVAARPRLVGVPVPEQRGYHVNVSAVNGLLFGLLSIEITLGPEPAGDSSVDRQFHPMRGQ